jgi:hypothetical protein
MKSVKSLFENYNLITEKDDSDARKLSSLVRAGLFDAKKLPLIKRAMDKEPSEMTISERKILLQLLDELMSHVLHSQQVYSKVKMDVSKKDLSEETKDYLSKVDPRYSKMPSEKDIPMVLLLKRKAIRMYPDRQKVALYYSQALDKYISIPFNEVNVGINESYLIEKKKDKKPETDDESEQKPVDPLKQRYKALKKQQKKQEKRDEKLSNLSHDDLKDIPGATKDARSAAMRKAGSELGKGHVGSAAHAVGWAVGSKIRDMMTKKKSEPAKPASTETPTPSAANATPKQDVVKHDTETRDKIKTKVGIKTKAPTAEKPTTSTTPAPAASQPKPTVRPRQMAIKQKFRASLRENFANRLNEKRMLKEYSAADAVDDATDVLVPYKSAYKNFKAGNYGHAALDAAIDTVGLAASIPSGGSSLAASTAAKTAIKGGVKAGEKLAVKAGEKAAEKGAIGAGEKAAEKGAIGAGEKAAEKGTIETGEKAAAKEGESAAAKEGEKAAAKPKPKAGNSAFGKLRKAAAVGAGLAALGAGAGGSKSGGEDDSSKTTEPGKFTLQAKTSRDSDIKTDSARAEKERQKLYREDFSVNLKDKPAEPAAAAPDAPAKPEKKKPSALKTFAKSLAKSKSSSSSSSSGGDTKTSEPGQFSMQVKTSSSTPSKGTDAARAEKERQKMYTESTINQLKKMKKNGIYEEVINIGNDTFVINNIIANKVINVYESLNKDNKRKAEYMLNESVDSFKKFINFTVRQ